MEMKNYLRLRWQGSELELETICNAIGASLTICRMDNWSNGFNYSFAQIVSINRSGTTK